MLWYERQNVIYHARIVSIRILSAELLRPQLVSKKYQLR